MGCGNRSKEEQAAAKMAEEIEEISRQNREEMQAEIDRDGAYSMRTERIDEVVEKFENASSELPAELRAQMADQAAALREIKAVALPYEQAYNRFIGLGGLDPVTMSGGSDIQARIDLLRVMYDENEKIDEAFPAIFAKLEPDPEKARAQLDLVRRIRQTDREMLPHMIDALEILKKHWSVSELGADGIFYFGAEVPDEDIEAYNRHIELMNAAADEQGRLQQLHMQMMQP